MYLVHTAVRSPTAGDALPSDTAANILALARARERVQHVCVHPDAEPDPVIGVYLLASCLVDAERRATHLCRRAVGTTGPLRGWSVHRSGAPMVVPYWDSLL